MSEQPQDPRSDRRNYMPLREDRARCLVADQMTTPALWDYVTRELDMALADIQQVRRREAFYRLVRVRQAVDELYLRGSQLALFTAMREPHEALQHWQDDGR